MLGFLACAASPVTPMGRLTAATQNDHDRCSFWGHSLVGGWFLQTLASARLESNP